MGQFIALLLLANCVLASNAQASDPPPQSRTSPAAEDRKSLFVFVSKPDYVEAWGKWKPDTSIGANAVEIQCYRESDECFEAVATISDSNPRVQLIHYKVLEWNKNDLIAEDDSAVCLTSRLLINFQEKSVMAIDTPKKDAKGMQLGQVKNLCQLANQTETYNLTR